MDKSLRKKLIYTKTNIYTVCEGVSFRTPMLNDPDEPRYSFARGDNRMVASVFGEEGLLEVKDYLVKQGYKIPAEYGQCIPFNIPNLKIRGNRLIITLKPFIGIQATKLAFDIGNTPTSFNQAANQAVKTLVYIKRLTKHIEKLHRELEVRDNIPVIDDVTR